MLDFIKNSEENVALAKKGMLIDNSIQLGRSIDEVITEFPDFIAEDYYEGGYYYSYPEGISYFIDEETREISLILLSGRVIINDLKSLDSIFGKRHDESTSGDDQQTPFWSTVTYQVGENNVVIELTEDDEIDGIWLSKRVD